MRNKISPSEYLAFLSVKYEVDPDRFFQALISASENHVSACEDLSIECRHKQKGSVVILITKGSKVVAQLPVSTEFLLQRKNPLRDAEKASVLCRRLNKKNRGRQTVQIKDLRIGMKSVYLRAKIVKVAAPKFVVTRFGNYATVANALISDDTGEIKMCLWNEQINSIAAGNVVEIENACVFAFKGEKQLKIGKKGMLTIQQSESTNDKRIIEQVKLLDK